MPSVRLAFGSEILTPSVLSDWTAAFRSVTGWPMAADTFMAKSPTEIVGFCALLDAANAATASAALAATTTRDFLIIGLPPTQVSTETVLPHWIKALPCFFDDFKLKERA